MLAAAVDDGAGRARYLDDIYDRDSNVLKGLNTPPGFLLTN